MAGLQLPRNLIIILRKAVGVSDFLSDWPTDCQRPGSQRATDSAGTGVRRDGRAAGLAWRVEWDGRDGWPTGCAGSDDQAETARYGLLN